MNLADILVSVGGFVVYIYGYKVHSVNALHRAVVGAEIRAGVPYQRGGFQVGG